MSVAAHLLAELALEGRRRSSDYRTQEIEREAIRMPQQMYPGKVHVIPNRQSEFTIKLVLEFGKFVKGLK